MTDFFLANRPNKDTALKEKALEVDRRLCQEYAAPFAFFRCQDPLSELVSSLLSHRTRNKESGRALAALRNRFPTWEEVRNAVVEDIEAAISAATWPEQKAPRIKAALQFIYDECGQLSLDFLADLPVDEAQSWLRRIPGVGPKTSAATLLFSTLRMPALPVDSHHHRVAQRLNLIPKSIGPGPAHTLLRAQLPENWNAQRLYDNHEALMYHGQRVCHYRKPACEDCVLNDLCPSRGYI